MPEFELFDEMHLRDKLEHCNHTMAKDLLLRQFEGDVIQKPLAALPRFILIISRTHWIAAMVFSE